jgi:hypothetical protein
VGLEERTDSTALAVFIDEGHADGQVGLFVGEGMVLSWARVWSSIHSFFMAMGSGWRGLGFCAVASCWCGQSEQEVEAAGDFPSSQAHEKRRSGEMKTHCQRGGASPHFEPMQKPVLIVAGGVLLAVNAVAVFLPSPNSILAAQTLSAIAGMVLVFLAIRPQAPVPVATQSPVAVPLPKDPVAPPPRAEAEVVALLGLFQEGGRLVDFLMEDISSAPDAQLAPAARVVHSGCRKVLQDYFEISPLRSEGEGARVTLQKGFEADQYRLIGTVGDQEVHHGRLLHHGWEAKNVKLPRISGLAPGKRWPVLAPAEVEVAS